MDWNDIDIACLRSITLSEFEPVNVSSLMVTNDSGATSHESLVIRNHPLEAIHE